MCDAARIGEAEQKRMRLMIATAHAYVHVVNTLY